MGRLHITEEGDYMDGHDKIEAFISHLNAERHFSQNTIAAYRNDISQFLAWLGEGSTLQNVADVKRSDIQDYLLYLKGTEDRGYAPSTQARKMAALKSFFHFLCAQDGMPEDPTSDLASPRVQKYWPKSITIQQVNTLLDQVSRNRSPEGIRDRAMLEVLYASGVRVSELVNLNLEHIDIQTRNLCCLGKGGKKRMVPLHERALEAVSRYTEEARPVLCRAPDQQALFLNHRGQRLTRQGFWLILKSYANAANIDGITPHTLRHSFAAHMIDGGTELRKVQEWLGHASISTTQVYTQVKTDRLPRTYDAAASNSQRVAQEVTG